MFLQFEMCFQTFTFIEDFQTTVLILLALSAYFRELIVSSQHMQDGDTLTIITVQQFPPSESFKSRVNFESQYGTCRFAAPFLLDWQRALMQFPRASKDLLMLAPSINLFPRLLVAAARSEPARSIKLSLATFYSSFDQVSTVIVKTA